MRHTPKENSLTVGQPARLHKSKTTCNQNISDTAVNDKSELSSLPTIPELAACGTSLEKALLYARNGYAVFPCRDCGDKVKAPYTAHGFHDATTGATQINEWWMQYPGALIGLPTGPDNGLIAIDLDIRPTGNGVENFRQLLTEHKITIEQQPPKARTQSGGFHLFFIYPNRPDKHKAKLCPMVDIKGNGGYIIAPGSIMRTGETYQWAANRDPSNSPLRQLPPFLEVFIFDDQNKAKKQAIGNTNLHHDNGTTQTKIHEALSYIPADDREIWLKIGMALKAHFSDTGYGIWCGWSRQSAKFDECNQQQTWDSLKNDGVAVGSLFKLAQQHGCDLSMLARKHRGDNTGSRTPDSQRKAWGKPDMSILDDKTDFSPMFDISPFPRKVQTWLKAHAELANAPVDYVVAGYLASIAALTGASRQVKAWGNWRQYLVLWLLIIGGPSSGKTPALKGPKIVLDRIEKPKRDKFGKALETWKQARDDGKLASPQISPGPKPVLERSTIVNCTMERKSALLAQNLKGLLETVDEMASLLGQNERYSSGGVDRGFQLSCYTGETFAMDRVKDDGEPLILERPCLSRLAGTQPEKLLDVYGGADDGHGGRHLPFMPAPVPAMRPLDDLKANDDMMLGALKRLDALTFGKDGEPVCLSLTADAANIFEKWWKAHKNQNQKTGGKLGNAQGKMEGQALCLAMTLTFSHWSVSGSDEPEPQIVGKLEVEAAIAWMDNYFKPTVKNILGSSGKPERAAHLLAKAIIDRKSETITATDIRRTWKIQELSVAKNIMEAVEILIDLEWLKWTDPDYKKGGSRKREWTVNPQVFDTAPRSTASTNATAVNTRVFNPSGASQLRANAPDEKYKEPRERAVDSSYPAVANPEKHVNTAVDSVGAIDARKEAAMYDGGMERDVSEQMTVLELDQQLRDDGGDRQSEGPQANTCKEVGS